MSPIYDHIYDTCTKTGKRRNWSQGATMLIMFRWYVSCWLAFVFFSVSMLIIDKNVFSLKGRRRRLQGTSEIRGLERCRSSATDLNLACERQTFLLVHRLGGTFREEERLRLSDRNSIPMTWINVYIINPVVMGFQMQICLILRFSCSILVKCCVHLRMSSGKTQMLLLEKTIFRKYWLFC